MSEMPSIFLSRTSSAMRSMQRRLVDLVGQLGDDDRSASAADLFDVRLARGSTIRPRPVRVGRVR